MVKIKIINNSRLSNTTYHKRCSGNQKFWWLKKKDGDFVPLPQRIRGDQNIEIELELEPGTYILGCGPAGNHGIRETIKVKG